MTKDQLYFRQFIIKPFIYNPCFSDNTSDKIKIAKKHHHHHNRITFDFNPIVKQRQKIIGHSEKIIRTYPIVII